MNNIVQFCYDLRQRETFSDGDLYKFEYIATPVVVNDILYVLGIKGMFRFSLSPTMSFIDYAPFNLNATDFLMNSPTLNENDTKMYIVSKEGKAIEYSLTGSFTGIGHITGGCSASAVCDNDGLVYFAGETGSIHYYDPYNQSEFIEIFDSVDDASFTSSLLNDLSHNIYAFADNGKVFCVNDWYSPDSLNAEIEINHSLYRSLDSEDDIYKSFNNNGNVYNAQDDTTSVCVLAGDNDNVLDISDAYQQFTGLSSSGLKMFFLYYNTESNRLSSVQEVVNYDGISTYTWGGLNSYLEDIANGASKDPQNILRDNVFGCEKGYVWTSATGIDSYVEGINVPNPDEENDALSPECLAKMHESTCHEYDYEIADVSINVTSQDWNVSQIFLNYYPASTTGYLSDVFSNPHNYISIEFTDRSPITLGGYEIEEGLLNQINIDLSGSLLVDSDVTISADAFYSDIIITDTGSLTILPRVSLYCDDAVLYNGGELISLGRFDCINLDCEYGSCSSSSETRNYDNAYVNAFGSFNIQNYSINVDAQLRDADNIISYERNSDLNGNLNYYGDSITIGQFTNNAISMIEGMGNIDIANIDNLSDMSFAVYGRILGSSFESNGATTSITSVFRHTTNTNFTFGTMDFIDSSILEIDRSLASCEALFNGGVLSLDSSDFIIEEPEKVSFVNGCQVICNNTSELKVLGHENVEDYSDLENEDIGYTHLSLTNSSITLSGATCRFELRSATLSLNSSSINVYYSAQLETDNPDLDDNNMFPEIVLDNGSEIFVKGGVQLASEFYIDWGTKIYGNCLTDATTTGDIIKSASGGIITTGDYDDYQFDTGNLQILPELPKVVISVQDTLKTWDGISVSKLNDSIDAYNLLHCDIGYIKGLIYDGSTFDESKVELWQTDFHHGGYAIFNGTEISIDDCKFNHNNSTPIQAYESIVYIKDSEVNNNQGSGLQLSLCSNVASGSTLDNVEVKSNKADGIVFKKHLLSFNGCDIKYNGANGISSFRAETDSPIEDCYLDENDLAEMYGSRHTYRIETGGNNFDDLLPEGGNDAYFLMLTDWEQGRDPVPIYGNDFNNVATSSWVDTLLIAKLSPSNASAWELDPPVKSSSPFNTALNYFNQGDYSTAGLLFKQIIQNSIESDDAIKALQYLLPVEVVTNQNYSGLYSFLDGLIAPQNTDIEQSIVDSKISVLIRDEQYVNAISQLQDIIDNTTSVIDSINASIEQAYCYMKLVEDESKELPKDCSMQPQSINEFVQMTDDLYWSLPYLAKQDSYDEDNPDIPQITDVRNYPNPFNPTTNICFSLKKPGKVKVKIYDVRGRLIKTLCNEILLAGLNTIVWDGKDKNERNASTGIYFYRISSKSDEVAGKMLLLK